MDDLSQQSGIQSIDYISKILELFCDRHAKLSLKEIASALNDSPAKVFRYLVSLTRIGLLQKTAHNEYVVGDLALDLCFKALNLLDPIEQACQTAKAINRESSYGVAVSIWGSLGPTVIKTYEPVEGIYSKIRAGSVMSLINSSIGNTFAQFLPEHILRDALELDYIRHSGVKLSVKERNEFMTDMHARRDQTITLMVDRPSPGLSSMSLPVFGISDEIQFVITAFHNSHVLLAQQDQFTQYLTNKIAELSRTIGLN